MPTSRAFDKLLYPVPRTHILVRSRSCCRVKSPGAARRTLFEAQFASFATTIQQRIDTDSGGSPTLSGSLSAQVERAVSQVMRRGNIALAGGPGNAYVAGTAPPTAAVMALPIALIPALGTAAGTAECQATPAWRSPP